MWRSEMKKYSAWIRACELQLPSATWLLDASPSFARFRPVATRMIHLDSDYKGIIRIGLTVHDAGERVEIATDRPNRKGLVWLPKFLCHNSGTVATNIDCWCEFEGWLTGVIKIHKRLHRNARLLSAQGGRLCQRFSFGPGGSPTVKILTLATA